MLSVFDSIKKYIYSKCCIYILTKGSLTYECLQLCPRGYEGMGNFINVYVFMCKCVPFQASSILIE